MSIPEAVKKINTIVLVGICVVLSACLMVGTSKIQAFSAKKEPVQVINATKDTTATAIPQTATVPHPDAPRATAVADTATGMPVIASKNGKKFHLPECPGAKAIIEKNRVVFPNQAAALAAGLTPAANCKGLKKP